MKMIATAMLALMAFVFLISKVFGSVHPAVGFVKAFAEAAMVGGMADWFAVTALFRHPLGLPIPHTAIIPRNKDRIGETMAQFLRQNFLTPVVVARRMGKMDVAGAVGGFLADPEHGGAGRLRDGASRLLADLLESLDDQRLGATFKSAIVDRLNALDVAPLLGRALDAAILEDRHLPLIEGLLDRAQNLLEANEAMVRDMVHERSGRILRWTGLDENVADAIIDGLNRLLSDVAADPNHPMRSRANEMLADFAARLKSDVELTARVQQIKAGIIENPAMQNWIGGLWDQGRVALLRAARDPERAMAGRIGGVARQLGGTLQADEALRDLINRFARRTTVGLVATYGDTIVTLVSDTVRGWDAGRVTERFESAVGRDLQYIRINGTLVGGAVGLLLHAFDMVF